MSCGPRDSVTSQPTKSMTQQFPRMQDFRAKIGRPCPSPQGPAQIGGTWWGGGGGKVLNK